MAPPEVVPPPVVLPSWFGSVGTVTAPAYSTRSRVTGDTTVAITTKAIATASSGP